MNPNSNAENEIKSLLIRERYYRDSCQWDKLRASYHPDPGRTAINITWFEGNIDGFVAGSQKMSSGGVSAIHTICPVEISVKGSKASAESTGSISIRFEQDGSEYDCISLCRFISRLANTQVGWRLLTLETVYIRDSIVPVVPGNGSMKGLILPDLKESRASYRHIGWLLARAGFTISKNLPGVDDERSIRKLKDSVSVWLEE